MFSLFAVLVHVFMLRSAHGTSCSSQTGQTCVATMYTLDKFNNNVCTCRDGFPIPTGCSNKLGKPTVTLVDSTRASIVEMNSIVAMVCSSTSVNENNSISFEWWRNSQLLNATESEYTVNVSNVNDTGLYSCQIKYGGYNASEMSDPVDLALLSGESNLTLIISGVPESAANGSTYNVTCNGLPVGVEPLFKINDNLRTNPMEAAETGNITCVYQNSSSPPAMTPNIVTDISKVDILVDGESATEYVYKTGTNVTLVCVTEPHEDYMNVGNATVDYTFIDALNATVSRMVSNRIYTLHSAMNHSVYCSATYNNQQPKNSTVKKFTFTDFYITPPVVTAEGKQLLEGSRAVLTCGQPLTGWAYSWAKDTVAIAWQHDTTIQIDNFTAADAGMYSCSMKKNKYIVESFPFNLSLATSLSEPQIQRSDKDFFVGDSYSLECVTASATAGMTYSWLRNNVIVPGVTDRIYKFDSINTNHSGNYTCKATFKTLTVESKQMIIYVGQAIAGKRCKLDADCKGTAYTGKCLKRTVYRCECSAGYHERVDVCQKSNMLVGSIVLIIAGAILSRMM